jgi:hypothetical protein
VTSGAKRKSPCHSALDVESPENPCHSALDAESPAKRRTFNHGIAGQAHRRQVSEQEPQFHLILFNKTTSVAMDKHIIHTDLITLFSHYYNKKEKRKYIYSQ